ncbi:hypothetical protein DY000_02044750, partial [Brassica cretica]
MEKSWRHNPELIGTDPDAKKGHVCYGSMTEEALRHIQKVGVPREIHDYRVFDYRKNAPIAENKKYSIGSIRKSTTKEKCVVCKLSNGRHVGNGGYVRVSLRVMFMVLRAEGEQHIRDDQSPQHVLSNFVCPIIRKRRVK